MKYRHDCDGLCYHRFKPGDIVRFSYRRKDVFAEVRSWNGQHDSIVRLLSSTGMTHRRLPGSLSRKMTEGEFQAAAVKLDGLRQTKRGRRAIMAVDAQPVEDVQLPAETNGFPDRHDVPLVMTEGRSSWPSGNLWQYIMQGGGERRQMRALRELDEKRYYREVRRVHPFARKADIAGLLKAAARHAA